MYPVLILRSELICLVILIFLLFTSRDYKIESENKPFRRILVFSIVHVIFDFITILTVNNMDTVPAWINWICHAIFYVSAILYSNELCNYVVAIVYPRHAKRMYGIGHLVTTLYILCLSFLKIEFYADNGTNSSSGPAAYVGYGVAFTFFILGLVLIFTHLDKMSGSIKTALIPMMIVLMVTEVCQIIWREVLFTGGAITIVTVGFFFSLENPVEVFKKKALTDALTGVHSRSSYEEDMNAFDLEFQKAPNEDYIFIFCDINDLRAVNNKYGHSEGDAYITLIASSISNYLEHATTVYRIGGDEFLVLYYKVAEEVVRTELEALEDACIKASEGSKYPVGVCTGFAKSSAAFKTLRDVVNTADYAMYQNKNLLKKGLSVSTQSGAQLNYTGLTDTMFDALSDTDKKTYPFITNMETNVTRISLAWKEYFGLDSEFYVDFASLWKNYIHPDDYEAYLADVIEVLNGHKQYHHYEYFAKRPDGEYVRVSCHGSMHTDVNTGTAFFAGYIYNYGVDENIDAISGLKNFDVLTSDVFKHFDNHQPFSILKLKLKNFARINMLYGFNTGNEVLKKIAEMLSGDDGYEKDVYCQNSVNFTILFEGASEEMLKKYYKEISLVFGKGIETSIGKVPLNIAGGALTCSGRPFLVDAMRSGLMFAVEESQFNKHGELVFHNLVDGEDEDNNVSLLSELHEDALADFNKFWLRYQPIVDVASKKVVGAEALLRWIHPVYGEVKPGRFISILEEDPCYYKLGLSILDHAMMDAKKFQEYIPGFRVNVNITALQLRYDSFIDDILSLLKKNDFKPDCLILELTERCKEMDGEFIARKIQEIKSKGMLVAFDDMGTGYSTINLLLNIPVDEVKLDKDFVQAIKDKEGYRLFVNSMVIGRTTEGGGYNICFEGVEDKETLDIVAGFGDFLVQGYYFSKPLLPNEFEEYIKGGK